MKYKNLLVLGLIGVFAVTLVAAYLVNSFTITTDVMEPFQAEYAILGDGGNWVEGDEECTALADDDIRWQSGADVDVGGLYAGEGRMVCVKVDNAAEADLPFTFSGEVVSGNGNLAECTEAFGNPTVSGVALAENTTKAGVEVTVATDATPVNDCEITVTLTRD